MQPVPERGQPCRRTGEGCGRQVELPRVARGQAQVAEGEGVGAGLGELRDALEVARGLGHLPAVHEQVRTVHPGAGGDAADDGRGLGDLVLVVGEHVVLATGVDVEGRAEEAERHRGALEVPAREPLAPRAGPAQLASWLRCLPQGEVGRVALVAFDGALRPVAGAQLVQRVAGQRSVPRERRDRVVDVAGVGHVGVPELHEPARQVDHVVDVLGRARERVGGQEVEQRRVRVEGRLVGIGDLT
jgi:hypothetical protein